MKRLAQELNKQGQHVVQLNIGTEFCKRGEGEYFLNPANDDDYDAVFRELQRLNKVPQKIVHLWNVVEDNRTKLGQTFWVTMGVHLAYRDLVHKLTQGGKLVCPHFLVKEARNVGVCHKVHELVLG